MKNNKDKFRVKIASYKEKRQRYFSLKEELFDEKNINERLLRQAIHVYQARQRQGTRKTKGRSEVSGSTRKIYRQKGTGRARHGDRKAPIFVGGGVAHGPQLLGAKPVLPRKMRRKALISALAVVYKEGKLKIIDELEDIEPKTKLLLKFLQDAGLDAFKKKNSILLVTDKKLENVFLAARNVNGITVRLIGMINAYDLLVFRNVVFLKNAIDSLQKNLVTDN